MGFVVTGQANAKRALKTLLLPGAVWIVYCIILLLTVPRHEPWFDEAQAWLLARDASYLELIGHYLRYEGSPGLWHTILAVPAKMGAQYLVLNYVSAAIATMGIGLFLFFSPFPALLKVAFPFTFFLLYQYAVVARSYALFPLLLFLLALVYPFARQRILLFGLLLALLANVSLHGFVIALAICGSYMWESRSNWQAWDNKTRDRHLIAIAGMALISVLLIFQLLPPPDITGYTTPNFGLRHLIAVSVLKISDSLTGNVAASAVVFLITCWWFWRTQTLLLFFSGVASLSLVAGIIYSHVWHEGLVLVFWLFVLWLSFDRARRMQMRVPAVVFCAVLLVAGVQIVWSVRSIRFDFGNSYSGSRQLAQYLRQNHLDESSIFAYGFKSISVLPYFQSNIFDNYHSGHSPSFWLWSKRNDLDRDLVTLSVARPQSVVLSVVNDADPGLIALRIKLMEAGYQLVRRFDGSLYWKDRVLEGDSYELWRPRTVEGGSNRVAAREK
jgi:hypothetical protein